MGQWILYTGSAAALAAWLYLTLLRGRFWRADQRLDGPPEPQATWPGVVALVPARDEADVIGDSVATLLRQDYPGPLRIVLIDDHSTDGTAGRAREAADAVGGAATAGEAALTVVGARALPAGWTGKVWALSEGRRHADAIAPDADYVWLTDADIAHDPANLRRLVAKAETGDLDMVSQMVLLVSRGAWARLLVPAFVYFFQKLYPFRWVNDPARRTAAAAGGCVLLRRRALDRIDGFEAIKDALIDDCALARAVRKGGRDGGGRAGSGRLWLGLTRSATGLRPYRGLAGVWRMVERSAYTQLDHSAVLLAGTLLGMAVIYGAAPLIALSLPLHGQIVPAAMAGLAWAMMSLSFLPTLRLYRQPAPLALLLPVAGVLYGAMTLSSAIAHWRGRGGTWKGRIRAGTNVG